MAESRSTDVSTTSLLLVCRWTSVCFHILAVVKNAAMHVEVHIPFSLAFLFSLSKENKFF